MTVVNPSPTTTVEEQPLHATVESMVTSAEPGWTTTEFWRTLAVEVVGLLTLVGVIHPASGSVDSIVGVIAMVGPGAAYAVSRGLRKRGTA